MSCPRKPTEVTLLKSVLEEHDVEGEDYNVILKGITKLFKDAKEKKDGGSGSAEEKAKRMEKTCSTAGMVVIILIALSMAGGAVYTAHCYAPTQFARLIKATNDQIRTTIEVILDTGFLSISLDDPEFIKECIEWLKKAALFYLGNKIVSGTDRITKLANTVCDKLGLIYRPETSSQRKRKVKSAERKVKSARRTARQSARATRNASRGTVRRRRPSPMISDSSDASESSSSKSESSGSEGTTASTRANPFHPKNA
jgi:hypothetical protein